MSDIDTQTYEIGMKGVHHGEEIEIVTIKFTFHDSIRDEMREAIVQYTGQQLAEVMT